MQKILPILLFAAASVHAAEFHISPEGAGTKDGSTPPNAAPASSASAIFNEKMKPGDHMKLGPGAYHGVSLTLNNGGTPDAPKTIEGAAGAAFSSDWTIDKPDKGATAISFGPGASNITLRDLAIRNYCFAIRAGVSKETPRKNIRLEGIRMEQMRHGIYVSDCDDMTVEDVAMKRYSKHGFRFDQGCDNVTVKNCVADCSEGDADWETKTELFPFGFTLNDGGAPNTKFVFQDCVAKNNIKSNQTIKYTNGDGFVAEGNTQDITFIRCRSLRNQDGGYDIKVKDARFTGCIATGHRRDYRIWHTATLRNCFAGFSQTGLWTKGGPVTVEGGTFTGHSKSSVEIEDKAPGPLTLDNCILVTGAAKSGAAIGRYDGTGTEVFQTGAEAGLTQVTKAWDGTGTTGDSTTRPAKGYSSQRVPRN